MSKTDELLNTLKGGNWDEGEALWLEILGGEIESIEPFEEAAHELWRRGQRDLGSAGFIKDPAAAWQTAGRGMDGLTLSLTFIVCRIKINFSAGGIAVINDSIIT